MELKNTYKSKITEHRVQKDIFFAQIDNNTIQTDTISKQIDKRFIQFYFCTKGTVTFHFSTHYQKLLHDSRAFVIYNASENVPLQLSIPKNSKLSLFVISIQKLHQIFNEDETFTTVFNFENQVKVYDEIHVSNNVRLLLNQIENYSLKEEFKSIYIAGKLNELLIHYFSEHENKDENCPYLSNEEIARKIKLAKDIIIENYNNPLSIKVLAQKTELNPYKLKEGFKKMYGMSISKFLIDYKIEIGKVKLDEKTLQVKEIAKELGYENPSHFIDAFKKKYGITPKQYQK